MKKLLSFLLALTLSFSLATFALADNEGGAAQFDPRLTITEKRDTIVVNVCETKENAEILAEKQPTLTVACGYTRAVVTDPNDMQIEATLKDGKISFVVATVGNYTIKRVSASASKPAAGSGKTDEPSHDDAALAETYPDVKKSDWHYEAVQFVTEEKLMTGTGKGFEPDAATTRAMLWTILARMDGTEVSAGNGAWYAAAQQWAEKTGVSDGTNPDGKDHARTAGNDALPLRKRARNGQGGRAGRPQHVCRWCGRQPLRGRGDALGSCGGHCKRHGRGTRSAGRGHACADGGDADALCEACRIKDKRRRGYTLPRNDHIREGSALRRSLFSSACVRSEPERDSSCHFSRLGLQ